MNNKDKYNLLDLVPYGLVVTKSWLLKERGIKRHVIDNWVKSGQLVVLTRGVFKRPDTNKLTWQGVVCSLQRMGSDLVPGGLTALTIQGGAQYVSSTPYKTVQLYGNDNLPSWINDLVPDTNYTRQNLANIFGVCDPNDSDNKQIKFTIEYGWGLEEWPLIISTPERALLEVLLGVPDRISFEHADQLFQGLLTLSPQRLNKLLECCTSIKVKRLFLWLAERNNKPLMQKHGGPWLKRIDLTAFNMESGALGSGKRVIAKGGKLDPKYLITVPQEMYEENYGYK
jgi:hypothetical protein